MTKKYSLNYAYPNDFDLCVEMGRVYSGNGMKPKTGDVILLTTKLDDGTALGITGVVVEELEKGCPLYKEGRTKWAGTTDRAHAAAVKRWNTRKVPKGWSKSRCWTVSWDCAPKTISADYDCVEGGKMLVADRDSIWEEFDNDSSVANKRSKATASVRTNDAARAANKKVRDDRAAYLATLPEWLREMSS